MLSKALRSALPPSLLVLCCSSVSQLGRMRLLDVGSCFNPFLKFDEFLTVGIDIVPAVEVRPPALGFSLPLCPTIR